MGLRRNTIAPKQKHRARTEAEACVELVEGQVGVRVVPEGVAGRLAPVVVVRVDEVVVV